MQQWLLLEPNLRLQQQLSLILVTTGGYRVNAQSAWPGQDDLDDTALVICNQMLLPSGHGKWPPLIAYGDGPLVNPRPELIGYADLSQQPVQAFAETVRHMLSTRLSP